MKAKNYIRNPKQLPDDDFSLVWARAQRPITTPHGFAVAGGTTSGVPSDGMRQLVRLVRERKPARALVDKAVEVIQAAADEPASADKVGKQCASIVLPQDPAVAAQLEYHSANLARQVFLPGYIEARGGDFGAFTIMDATVAFEDEAGDRIVAQVPKVGHNKPCPCGSGRKYKQCHGKRQESGWRIQLGGSPRDGQDGQETGNASTSNNPT